MFLERQITRKFNWESCFATDFSEMVLDRKLVDFLNIGQKSTPLLCDKLNTKNIKTFLIIISNSFMKLGRETFSKLMESPLFEKSRFNIAHQLTSKLNIYNSITHHFISQLTPENYFSVSTI
jgi:hypothetical protein